MECGRVVPRLPLGSEDEFVVKVSWEGPEETESSLEPVPGVFDGATAVLREELKALRLMIYQKRGLIQRHGLPFFIILRFGGGIPNSELMIFGFI